MKTSFLFSKYYKVFWQTDERKNSIKYLINENNKKKKRKNFLRRIFCFDETIDENNRSLLFNDENEHSALDENDTKKP